MVVHQPLATEPVAGQAADRPPARFWWLSIVAASLLAAASAYGMFAESAYRLEDDLAARLRGQDLVTFAAIPLLLWVAWRAMHGSLRSYLVWLGIMAHVVYAYAWLATAVPHNDAFVLYVALLGTSVFAFVTGLFQLVPARVGRAAGERAPVRSTASFLLAIGTVLAVLWLADLLPTIPGHELPERVPANDMPNLVYVLDLAFFVPALIVTGVMLLLRRDAGFVLGAVLLVKITMLGLSLAAAGLFQALDDLEVDATLVLLGALIAGVAATLLLVAGSRMRSPGRPCLRRSAWDGTC